MRGLAQTGAVSFATNVHVLNEHSNRGKRSIGIDISTPDGLEILYRLAENSDVFLTSFLPAARRRLEIDVEHIRARR